MFEDFKKNLEVEREILSLIKSEKREAQVQSYVNMLKVLNAATPELLKRTSPVRSISTGPIDLVGIVYSKRLGTVYVRSVDKEVFKQQLRVIYKDAVATQKKDDKTYASVRPSLVKSYANSMFRNTAEKMLPSVPGLEKNIKRANMAVLPSTYLAIALFFSFFSIFLGIAAFGVLLLISLSFWTYFWIIVGVPCVVFLGFYYYPATEAGAVEKAISYELPFAAIHMTAIAGSDLEPTKIFHIIAKSKEYVNIGKEMQKILVLVQVYGYDLVTSLKNVSQRTSNEKLSELLNGLATNISGGGGLKTYLEKKSENFLLDYQLERKKYIDLASTFMDIYISILIAAPMVLMLMFIIMNVAGLGFQGLSIEFLMMISVAGIVVVNIIFIFFISLKQPKV